MLLSASIKPPRCLLRLLDRRGDDVREAAEPLGFLDELAALDLEDLHPAAALVVFGVDLERRDQPAETEIPDLLEALLDVLALRRLAAGRLDRVAHRLDMHGGPQDAAVVEDRVVHDFRRVLALRLVHRADFLAYRVV